MKTLKIFPLLLLFSSNLLSTAFSQETDKPPTQILIKFNLEFNRGLENCLSQTLKVKKPCGNSKVDRFLAKYSMKELRPVYTGLVGQKKKSGKSELQIIQKIKSRFPKRTRRITSKKILEISSTYVMIFKPETSQEEIVETINRLKREPQVLIVQQDQWVYLHFVPNDPRWLTAGACRSGVDDLYGLKQISSEEGWNISRGLGTTVAVVDTGVDYNHEDIASNIWTNTGEIPGNGIDDDENGYVDDIRGWDFNNEDADPMDDHFHGTHVAGSIAATGNNEIGVIGVAFETKLMTVKVMNGDGRGSLSNIAEGIRYAADMGADGQSHF